MMTNAISDQEREEWRQRGLEIDPVSGLPVGTIIQNHKGEFGVVGFECVIRISKEKAEQLRKEFSMVSPLATSH